MKNAGLIFFVLLFYYLVMQEVRKELWNMSQ